MASLIHNQVIQVDHGPWEGTYRVVLAMPLAGKTALAKLTNTGSAEQLRGRKKRLTTKHPRKKAPLPLVGELIWIDDVELRLLEERIRVVELEHEQFILSTADQKLFESRKVIMTEFLDYDTLCQAIHRHGRVTELVSATVNRCGVSKSLVYKLWSQLCRLGFSAESLRPRRNRCGARGIPRSCDPGGRKKSGRKTNAERVARITGQGQIPTQPHGGIHHDLPNCIDEFAKRTHEMYGSAREICVEQTLLQYYRRFMSIQAENHAVSKMRSGSVANLKYQMGLLTSRFRANHPLKACRQCIAADRFHVGWAYWHNEHQFPGVWICPSHKCLLEESTMKATGVGRFLWHLPNENLLRPLPFEKTNSERDTMLARIGALTIAMHHSPSTFKIDSGRLHNLYFDVLTKRGLVTANGNFRLSTIATEFELHVRPLRSIAEFLALPADKKEACGQLARYLRAPRTGTHPLRHVVLINWLFPDFNSFLESYENHGNYSQCTLAPSDPFGTSAMHACKKSEQKLVLETILAEHRSIRYAALKLGIDTATALAWAAELGIQTTRRPKVLKPPVRQAVIDRLQAGEEKAKQATQVRSISDFSRNT